MNVEPNDLVMCLIKQREVQATEAATMAAACEGLKREIAAKDARIAELEAQAAEKAARRRKP